MEQFRQIGEALGSIKALMMFRDEIRVNQRQCCLLADALDLAFDRVADEIRAHLRFDEKLIKWKALEHPLRELHRLFREAELYLRLCLEPPRPSDWWSKAVSLAQNSDCVDLHLHDLLWCVPVVVEAIEAVAEITGTDHDDIYRKKFVFSKKYEREWMEPKLFLHRFGKLYLATQELSTRMDAAWREDRWLLSETIADKKNSKPFTKQESRLAELLVSPRGKLFPLSVLAGSNDYQVRRRFGSANNYKEVLWMGESYAVKHVIGEVDQQLMSEISLLSSVSHPNVLHYMYSFVDEEKKKECIVVMELMSRDLFSYIKEICSTRRKVPFTVLVAVDTMLQIARGMEYLHSRNIYHGDLNPSNILVKTRNASPEGHLHAKVTGFGLSPAKNPKNSANQAAASAANPCIWYAPEVLLEQERSGGDVSGASKCTEKADVYSFGMICFQLLTGKVPFEDEHLQGDKMSKNIRAGERPLFPFQSPKYLTNLTKRCWHADPSQRPSFSSICRVLRYIKRFLIMNPDHCQPDAPVPPVDYYELDVSLCRRFPSWARKDAPRVSEIPFQMYAYRVVERERTTVNVNVKDRCSDSGSEGASICSDENAFSSSITLPDDTVSTPGGSVKTPSSSDTNSSRTPTKKGSGKNNKQIGQLHHKTRTKVPSHLTSSSVRNLRTNSDVRLRPVVMSPRGRRVSGHVSDSELIR